MIPQLVYIVGILIIILVFGLKSFFSSDNYIKANRLKIESIIYIILFFMLALHFWEKEFYMGIVAVVMGGMAIFKYLNDKNSETDADSE